MKYHHFANHKLTQSITAWDKIIHTTNGSYKVRKNGRVTITIDAGKDIEETLRVTPIK